MIAGFFGEAAGTISRLLPHLSDYAGLPRTWRRDILAGITVGVVALPLALAFGISSFSCSRFRPLPVRRPRPGSARLPRHGPQPPASTGLRRGRRWPSSGSSRC